MKITRSEMHDFQRQWDDYVDGAKAFGEPVHLRYGQAWYNRFMQSKTWPTVLLEFSDTDIARLNRIHAEPDPGRARALIEHFIAEEPVDPVVADPSNPYHAIPR